MHYGVSDNDGISPYYKAFVSQDIPGVGFVTVVGYIDEECTVELQQLWQSPFEGDTVGASSGLAKVGDVTQAATGATSKSLMNSRLVWEGANPLEFQLVVHFTAYSDAKREVDDPIRYLSMMSSPELEENLPTGQVPQLAMLDLGRKLKAQVYIKTVSYNFAAPKTKSGHWLNNTVTLNCSTDGAVNRSRIPQIFL
jgi:hypothetical protein